MKARLGLYKIICMQPILAQLLSGGVVGAIRSEHVHYSYIIHFCSRINNKIGYDLLATGAVQQMPNQGTSHGEDAPFRYGFRHRTPQLL